MTLNLISRTVKLYTQAGFFYQGLVVGEDELFILLRDERKKKPIAIQKTVISSVEVEE